MKIALCTTTVNVPHALKLLRKSSADVMFFVAGDKASPHSDIVAAQTGLAPYDYLFPDSQNKWKCSWALGWDTISRRNIAFLEAVQWGADVIYSWDDDNLAIGTDHFDSIEAALGYPFSGVKLSGTGGWFDPGVLLCPTVRHRGFPYSLPISKTASTVVDAKVGVAAGLVIGDPDIDASTRIEHKPDIGQVHLFGEVGCLVDPHVWTVFNSQNTAVLRELVPAWFLMPGVGRHDDIYASLIVQRVARERRMHVHFGPPFTYQERNEHNLIKDMRAEIDGMENVEKLAKLLDSLVLPGRSVIEDVRMIYGFLRHVDWMPQTSIDAACFYLDDCEAAGCV